MLPSEADFSERHSIRVEAPRERVLAAVRDVDPGELPVVRMLFRLRGVTGLPQLVTVSETSDELVRELARPPRGLRIELAFRFDGATLTTETSVWAADARSRRRFRPYWLAIRPFSGLIRRVWLRAIKRRAERG